MRRLRIGLLGLLVAGLVLAVLAGPAAAARCPHPPNRFRPCVETGTGGSGGGTHHGGGGGTSGGGGSGPVDPCAGAMRARGSYASLVDPQPPKSDPLWGGHTTGAIYQGTSDCKGSPLRIGPWTNWEAWIDGPTPIVRVDPAVLARQAMAAIPLPKPVLHRSPSETLRDAGQPYTYVNAWTWFWTTPAVWQTRSRTASLGPVWATVTVQPVKLTFVSGEAGRSATCAGPGRAWTTSDGDGAPSAGGCAFQYKRASGSVTSTLQVTWQATWTSSTGAGGALPTAPTTAVSTFQVEQIESVNT